jgi:hypothetical protein
MQAGDSATAGFLIPFAIRNLGAIWPKPPCHKPYSLVVFSRRRPEPWSPYGLFSTNRFWICPVAGLSVIRAEGFNENRPTLRDLRVEELAAFTQARRSAHLRSW